MFFNYSIKNKNRKLFFTFNVPNKVITNGI